ncbi:13532_t:CDS:2, partial [Dentiscutata heterogama]
THETEPLQLWLQDHKEEISFNLIPSPHYHVILDPSCSDHSNEHTTIKVFPENNNKNQERLYM